MNGERKDINVPVFSCWLQDKEFKEPHELSDTFLFPNITIDGFLRLLLDGASSCNLEDELTLHLGYMLADNTKPDKEKGDTCTAYEKTPKVFHSRMLSFDTTS